MDIKALFSLAGLHVDHPQKVLELYRASIGMKNQLAILSAAMETEVDHHTLSKLGQINSIIRSEPCVRYRNKDELERWFNDSRVIL